MALALNSESGKGQVLNVKIAVLVILLVSLAACGHGDNPPPAAPVKTLDSPVDTNKPAAESSEFVSQILTKESQGERPEEIQLSTRAPFAYGFDLPIHGNPAINYFFGPRVWGSLNTAFILESHAQTSPVVLIHAADSPKEILMNLSSKKHWEFHGGVDVQAKEGTSIYAPADGVVFSAGPRTCVGETVVIRHEVKSVHNIVFTIYNHLQKGSYSKIKIGDVIKKGSSFAKVWHTGDPGCVEGAHLHFEIRTPINGPLGPETIDNWGQFLAQTAKQNPADYVKVIDQACQTRKNAEIANAFAVARAEPGAVAPLSAGRCSFKYESSLGGIPSIYRVWDRSQITTLGLK